MNARKLVVLAAGAVLLAACNDDDSPSAPTVTALVSSEIAHHTADTVEPIELNFRSISDADTDDISQPVAVN